MTLRATPLTKQRAVRPAQAQLRLSPPRPVGWGGGEQTTYAIRLAGVEGGRAAIAVGRPRIRMGRKTLKLRGLGETVPFISAISRMSEELISQIDLEGLFPLRTVAERKGSDKDRKVEYLLQKNRLQLTILQGKRTRTRTRRIIGPAHDPLSALFALRSANWRPGTQKTLFVFAGTQGLYRVDLHYAGRQRIHGRLGWKETIRITGIGRRILDNGRPLPQKKPRNVTIWFSADHDRIPLKLVGDTSLGQVEATISSYHPPTRRVSVRVGSPASSVGPKSNRRRPRPASPPLSFGTRR